MKPPTHGGAQGRDREQREIEHRRGRAACMQHIGIGAPAPHDDQRDDHAGRGRKLSPSREPPKASPPMPRPASTAPSGSNGSGVSRPHVLDEDRRQDDAGEPDRDVDQEDPVPGDVGGDEAAERRADQRPDQRRQRHPDHGVDQLAPVDAAHEDQACRPASSWRRPCPRRCARPRTRRASPTARSRSSRA